MPTLLPLAVGAIDSTRASRQSLELELPQAQASVRPGFLTRQLPRRPPVCAGDGRAASRLGPLALPGVPRPPGRQRQPERKS